MGLNVVVFCCLAFAIVVSADAGSSPPPTVRLPQKVCSGSSNGFARLQTHKLLDRLHQMYANCTIVTGNLELVSITMDDLETSEIGNFEFLQNIEEVMGYVLIAFNELDIYLPKLKIIWGDMTFSPNVNQETSGIIRDHALLITHNLGHVADLRSLRAVIKGNVAFAFNDGFCFLLMVDWVQLLGIDGMHRLKFQEQRENYTINCEARDDGPFRCHPDCKHCWGPEKDQCQQIYRTDCAPQCMSNMCFNTTNPAYCCSPVCAAGCYGPTADQCFGCKYFKNGNMCVDKCPQKEYYDAALTKYVYNADGKYAFNHECVDKCPEQWPVYKDGCVINCPDGYFKKPDSPLCEPCNGPCPKQCSLNQAINAKNIYDIMNCTYIDGFVEIRRDTFEGASHSKFDSTTLTAYGGITEEMLEILSTVEQITHYLFVQAPGITSLRFLRNLKKIDGRYKYMTTFSLHVSNCDSLYELGLQSLEKISDGDIYIGANEELCYVNSVPWNEIAPKSHLFTPKLRSADACEREERVCHQTCEPRTGCWGGKEDMCFACKSYKMHGNCVDECPEARNYYVSGKNCLPCHHECKGCNGPTSQNCTSCQNMRLEETCVSECPTNTHYHNKADGTCLPCHLYCFEYGCTGPGSFVGEGGCKRCPFAALNETKPRIASCMPELSHLKDCRSYGLENYFMKIPSAEYLDHVNRTICAKCHDACNSCTTFGTQEKGNDCMCKRYRMRNPDNISSCSLECPHNHFTVRTTPDNVTDCVPCNRECEGCYGPLSTHCVACLRHKDYLNNNRTLFNCVEKCPPERQFIASDGLSCTDVNYAEVLASGQRRTVTVVATVIAAMFLILLILATVTFILRRRLRTSKYLQPQNEMFEIVAEAKPNLSRLQLIVETDLKRGGVLGLGAFGTVYKGIWNPESSKNKIPVAIKVLHEANTAAQKEMLEEAAIMASIQHTYLVRLIGVCVGHQLMLVTPLMPLGSLLEYLHNNRARIGSAHLIRWCLQIATGMAHLEEHRLVHRDLAARNVLVQSPYCVKITDFGLAKWLDYGSDELKISEGKIPIKWLALECLQHQRYTHKSDVWAYGVTVWELLTFGEKPYKDVPLQSMTTTLERGDRLPQPRFCTLPLYMVLIQCWMVDADTRPSFKDLMAIFSNFMKAPGQYFAIDDERLLRLPDFTQNDHRNMLEQLLDESDIRDADDFLDSQSPPTPSSSTSQSKSFLPTDSAVLAPHLRRGRIANDQRQQSTSSHRYASDPLKTGFVNSERKSDSSNPQELATDPDNYLVPDSQNQQRILTPETQMHYTPVIAGNFKFGNEGAQAYYEDLRLVISGVPVLSENSGLDNREYLQPSNCDKEALCKRDFAQTSSTDSSAETAAETETVV